MQQSSNRFKPFLQMNEGNFGRSLSGSETDVSTSNENLSNEEKYVIRHTPRQEPQGQENLNESKRSSFRDSLPSNRSSLDVTSSYNTLIIHNGNESWPGVQEITEIPDDYLSQSSVLKHLAKEVKTPSPNGSSTTNDEPIMNLLNNIKPTLLDIDNISASSEIQRWSDKSPLQQAVGYNSKLNTEKIILSKSQPDLTSADALSSEFNGFKRGASAPRPPTRGREENESKNKEMWPSAEMVEILIKENSALKQELENCYARVGKTQKLEQEMLKIHKGHEELVQSCERRERLERAARSRLQSDLRRQQELNRSLREQVELFSSQLVSRSPNPDSPHNSHDGLRRELSRREALIKQLITQNKELSAAKERQEIELTAQRATLQEQRTHIDILDTALTNAQANVVRLEEESRKKHVYVERVVQLQRALSSMQIANDRREQTERKLRIQLERELQRSKSAQAGDHKNDNTSGGGVESGWDLPDDSVGDASELKRRLREKDERIMLLEGECSKWEQRFLEESALRQAAIDAASIPKDAKIAALEKTSQETEKIIAEARNEKIRHMDEVHAAQKKVADLESRLKDLESKLAEKDAMIRVLQKHTYDKDVSSMLGCSPHHTPHGSLSGTDIDHVLGATASREELVSRVLTSSTVYGSGNSYAGSESSYHVPSFSKYDSTTNYDSTKKTLDSQLKEIDSQLDSQLLTKRALCCFPGFPNSVTTQRKGKVSKPLLAGVGQSGSPATSGIYNTATSYLRQSGAGDMMLLEKQGRTSQQQRHADGYGKFVDSPGNPSSLPRPPKSAHRSGLPRRMGEYNRLGDGDLHRIKSDADSVSSNVSSRLPSPARTMIPPPRKRGEYGRLSESGGSSSSLRKPSPIVRNRSSGERDSGTSLSDNSANSLPPPTKISLYGSTLIRKRASLGRENKSSTDSSTSKYRIEF